MDPGAKSMTESESLSIITGMINKAQNRFNETGTLYLLWGWVIFICCACQFIMQYFLNYENAYRVWFLTWLAVIYQIIYLVRKQRKATVKTYTDDIVGYVWMAFGICMFIVCFILLKQKAFTSINPVILVMYSIPTFLSGKILKFPPLAIGGYCCAALAMASPFIPFEFHQLLIAAAVVLAWIIPGYLLRAKFKKEQT